MQEAKPVAAVYTDEETGEKIPCMVLNSNILINGRRYMSIKINDENRTVPAQNVEMPA